MCGVVDAVGRGVDLALGTRVMAVTTFFDGRGGFAESATALAATCFRAPPEMRDIDAAAFRIGFSTAWIGLVRRAALRAGEWLVVLGAAGGSGAAAVQLGHALAARVIAVAAGPEKLDSCARLGAEVLIDRTSVVVPDAVLEATGAARRSDRWLGNGRRLRSDPRHRRARRGRHGHRQVRRPIAGRRLPVEEGDHRPWLIVSRARILRSRLDGSFEVSEARLS